MAHTVYHYCDPHMFPKKNEILFSRQKIITEDIELPCQKPDIEGLIEVKARPRIENSKVVNSPTGRKIYVRGKIEQEIFYTAYAPCQPVHTVCSTHAFSTFIEIPCGCQYSNSTLELQRPAVLVEFIEAHLLNHREITKSVILFIWYPNICVPCPPRQTNFSRNTRQYGFGQTIGHNVVCRR